MQDELELKEEHDVENEISVNPIMAEVQASIVSEEKKRRYWDATEEKHFHEIWGRDNWLLTRHGKNTKFFAKWSEELKERYNLDIKPEEIQAKVNQTRAKFRQVKKHPKFNRQNPTWKKFHVVEKILKNRYRPADADPIPPDALRKNRDLSPGSDLDCDETTPSREQPPTPNSHASNSQDTNTMQQAPVNQGVIMNTDQMNNSTLDDHDISVNLFNANELQPNPEYDYIKQEFATDYSQQQTAYSSQYTAEQNHFTAGMPEEPPQLLELQTPQQQFQHQLQTPQQQQQQQQQQIMQQQQQQQYNNVATPSNFDHHSVPNNIGAYNVSSADAMNLYNNQQQQQHYGTTTMAPSVPMPQPYNNVGQAYNMNNGNSISNNTDNNNINNNNTNGVDNGIMQPPRPTPQPRKRGRQPGSQTNHALAIAKSYSTEPSLESMYLDEVRKKNVILDEQKEIERKRLHVEERKVSLMEEFFPKCLEMQSKILEKLLNMNKIEETPPLTASLPSLPAPPLTPPPPQQQPSSSSSSSQSPPLPPPPALPLVEE